MGDDRHGSQSSSRPGTVTRRVSRSGGDGKALARPISAPFTRTAPVPSRPGTGTSISSETSDQVEERCLQFQKMFQCKNLTKFKKLKDAFRNVDVDKNGVLGPDEVAEAMASLDIPVDKRLVDHLMSRCDDQTSMSLMDFKDLLWVDDTLETYIDDRKNRKARGALQTGCKYLWTRILPKPDSKFVGCLNDTLEADKIEAGNLAPRLDGNFSSVNYNPINFSYQLYQPPPQYRDQAVHRLRPGFFDAPPPAGRRVAYDRGYTPYNMISLESPRLSTSEAKSPTYVSYSPPVRLSTFSRIHAGETPTQLGHMLSKTVV